MAGSQSEQPSRSGGTNLPVASAPALSLAVVGVRPSSKLWAMRLKPVKTRTSRSRVTATSRLTAARTARAARSRVALQGAPGQGLMAGDEVLAIGQVRDLLGQGLELLGQQAPGGRGLAIEGPAGLDLQPGGLDLGHRAAVFVRQAPHQGPTAEGGAGPVEFVAMAPIGVEQGQGAIAADARLRRDHQGAPDPRVVQACVVDFQDLGRLWVLRGRLPVGPVPGLAAGPGSGQPLPRIQAGRWPTAVAAQPPVQSVGRIALQPQVGPLAVRPAVLPIACLLVGQEVPGQIAQPALGVGDDPGHLLQPRLPLTAAAGRRVLGRLRTRVVPGAAPGPAVQKTAAGAAHPARETQGRDTDTLDGPVLKLPGQGGLAQFLFYPQGCPQQVHIAQRLPAGLAVAVRPFPDVLDHIQVVVRPHDGADTAEAEQMGPAGGDESAHRIFTRAVFSTLRMLLSVAHRPLTRASWA